MLCMESLTILPMCNFYPHYLELNDLIYFASKFVKHAILFSRINLYCKAHRNTGVFDPNIRYSNFIWRTSVISQIIFDFSKLSWLRIFSMEKNQLRTDNYLTIAIPFFTSFLHTACTSRLVLPADRSAALYVSCNEKIISSDFAEWGEKKFVPWP